MPHDAARESHRPPGDAVTRTGQLGLYELRSGDVLAGRFRIESILGIGGMGVVYRAYDQSLGLDVAIKLLRPELARRPEAFERFRQELLLARQVSSSHVVRIHDLAQDEGRWFISMDFVDGESLEHRLDQESRLPTDQTLAIIRGLLEGLVAAHQRGVVHRDLKPANILLDKTGHAYITDFGVARSLGSTGMTQSGMIVGTPEYLSPEQARGENVDARSDLYAIGLILYEMLSGSLPFAGGTPAETVMQRIVRQPPSIARTRPDLPRWLQALCDRLLKLKPAHRFASARDALRALDSRHVPRAPLNRRALLIAALVLTIAAGAADWIRLHPELMRTPPAVVSVTPRVALLPITAPPGDTQLAAVSRALGAHLFGWLRNDRGLGVVPAARMSAALARTVPDATGNEPLRHLADIAHAANASRIIHGDLRHEDNGLALELSLVDPSPHGKSNSVVFRGADTAALFAAYVRGIPPLLATDNLDTGAVPDLGAAAFPLLGAALIALDSHLPEAAATDLAPIASIAPGNVLIDQALLEAQQAAGQEMAAQATRDVIIKSFANDTSAAARELYAQALIGNNESGAAVRTLAKAVKDYPHDASLAILYAQALSANADSEQALGVLTELVKTDDQDARAWFLLGRISIVQGQAQAAVDDYLVRALVLDTRSGDRVAEAETRNALGIGYERLGQLDAAIDQDSQAVAMREKLADESGVAKSLRNLAIAQAERGDRDTADRTLDRAQALLVKNSDSGSLADLYNDRGVIAEEHGNFADALKYYRQALAVRQQLNLPDKIAESLNNIGFSSYQIGDFDNARVYWQQALTQFQKIDDHDGVLHIEQSIGLLDTASGHFVEARKRLLSTLQSAQDHQLPEETAVAHIYLAELAFTQGRLADAGRDADAAMQIYMRRADQRGQAEASLLKARLALALGDEVGIDKAVDFLSAAKLDDEQLAELLLVKARRADLSGDRAAASAALDAADNAAGKAHSGMLAARIQLERARHALAAADIRQAHKLLAALRAEMTRLGDVPLRLELLELEIAASLRDSKAVDAIDRYHEAVALLRSCGRYRHAVVLHELGALALKAKPTEAAAAHASADSARAELLADAPEEMRSGLQQQLAAHLRRELGADDAK